jgi:hypothetical protein
LMLEISGAAGTQYELAVWNPSQIVFVEGAELLITDQGETRVRIQIPANASEPHPMRKSPFTSRESATAAEVSTGRKNSINSSCSRSHCAPVFDH